MKAYSEPEKKKVREEAISFAIESLTKERFQSTLARNQYVREVRDFLLKNGNTYDQKITSKLDENVIDHWEKFYLSLTGTKQPQDLKVAYLSGPNPENDLEIFIEKGILPENVWAFESDNKTYDNAVLSALNSEFPFVKIYRGKIENYFKILHTRFDIIYLDFCSTINSSGTLSVVREVFLNQKLNSPGILITNFAFPSEEQSGKSNWHNQVNLAANYLYPKAFTESLEGNGGGFVESAEAHSITHEEFIKMAFENPNNFYGQLITRILYDLPSVLIPFQKFCANPSLINIFFKNFEKKFLPNDIDEDYGSFPNENALIWGLNNYIIENPDFDTYLSKFCRQLSIVSDENKLRDVLQLLYFFTVELGDDKFYSETLQTISDNWNPFQKYVFCDVFLFHQLKDILMGQLTNPYHYNVGKTKRWSYQAKKTRMFMDLIVYDECRYIYDWMPTIDMFENGVSDINRELSLRFAMDSIAKQRRWYNEEFFYGTAVIDQNTRGFEAQELEERVFIN